MKTYKIKSLSLLALCVLATSSLKATSLAEYDGSESSYDAAIATLTTTTQGTDSPFSLSTDSSSGNMSITKYLLNTSTNTVEAVTLYVDIDEVGDSSTATNGTYYYIWDSTTNKYIETTYDSDSGTYVDSSGTSYTSYDFAASPTVVATNSSSSVSTSFDGRIYASRAAGNASGGAIVSKLNSSGTIENSYFIYNSAVRSSNAVTYGGAISNTSDYSMKLLDATFIGNVATSSYSGKGVVGGAYTMLGLLLP